MVTTLPRDVFRFVAVRPPTPPTDDPDDPGAVLRDERSFDDTFVGRTVVEIGEARSQGRLLRVLASRAAEADVTPRPPDDGLGSALGAVVEVARSAVADGDVTDLRSRVEAVLGRPVGEVSGDERLAAARGELWDRLETHYLLTRARPTNLDALVDALRALRLIELLAAGDTLTTPEAVDRVLTATLVLPDTTLEAEPDEVPPSRRAQAQAEHDAGRRHHYAALWEELVEVSSALTGLRLVRPRAEGESRIVKGPRATGDAGPADGPPPVDEDVAGRPDHPGPLGSVPPVTSRPDDRLTVESLRLSVPASFVEALPESVRRHVPASHVGNALSDRSAFLGALEDRMRDLTEQLVLSGDPLAVAAMPEAAHELPGMRLLQLTKGSAPAIEVGKAPPHVLFPWQARPIIRPLGIGDLKVVKEVLLRYVAGEVAHIENVLDGELKSRDHRALNRSEETLTVLTETVEETERDTQTTDRFELKKETEKTIQQDMSVDAGVTVSASYGPVELGAYGNFAYSESSTETTKNSQNFARDVVDRSLTKIQKRAREERVTKTLREIEESNIHTLDNTPSGGGHITGVYRWVDKHYQAQIYNYGRRMMFEFVVPEPAAYYWYAQENDPSNQVQVTRPQTLTLATHKDVTPWNFGAWVRAYNIQGVTPPPPEWKVVTLAVDQNGMTDDQAVSKSTKEIVVPDGYEARDYGYRVAYWHGTNMFLRIHVGLRSSVDGASSLDGEDSIVPVSIVAADIRAYAANIEVFCERTARLYESWQITTFEKIVASYETAKQMYEDKLKAAQAARGVVIEGRNPLSNASIIRNELKRLCLTIFTAEDFASFNAVSGAPPVVDLDEAVSEGRFAQFFEQAFEWEQMTYLFYPYFWSRPTTWTRRLAFEDRDPRFNQFLQAGASRVVIPVHPAYNDAILHFVETGAIWNGGTPPHLDDPLFVSIVEELKAQTDDLDGAVPEGDPWRVVVPTTLVWLQPGPELPDFTV